MVDYVSFPLYASEACSGAFQVIDDELHRIVVFEGRRPLHDDSLNITGEAHSVLRVQVGHTSRPRD